MTNITQILSRLDDGDSSAADQLLPLVYSELRKLAAVRLANESPGQTLEATALVHDAYLRIVGGGEERRWDGRGHFFAAAAEAMRRILVENARRKSRRKHGGGMKRQRVEDAQIVASEVHEDLISLDTALEKLEAVDPKAVRLVHLRYFAGCTNAEAAEMMGISARTADRLWAFARAWLHQEITGQSPENRPTR